MIVIKSPRYRDRTVLLARYRLPCGQDVKVKITEGAYKGIYNVANDVICKIMMKTIMMKEVENER